MDATVVDGTSYFYQVSAVNTAGESTLSAQATANASAGWQNVKMGGGGYIPGVIYHPIVADPSIYGRVFLAGRGMIYNE